MKYKCNNDLFAAACLVSVALGATSTASWADSADELFSKPVEVFVPNPSDMTDVETSTWEPPAPVDRDIFICASFPTMQDPYWLAANYGIVTEARRLGVTLDILNAGSFKNLSTQVSQLNDCAAKGADAVLVAPISAEGVSSAVRALSKAGIPVVNIIPRIADGTDLAGRSTLDYYQVGVASAQYLLEEIGDAEANVALFPGPPGADWAARTVQGFESVIAGTNVNLVTTKFGNTDKSAQYNLIADTLNATPDLDWVVSNAVGADAAVSAISAAGLAGKVKIGSTYQTGPVRDAILEGTIEWALNDNVAVMASIGLDMAVKAISGDLDEGMEVWPVPQKLTIENADAIETVAGFAPEGYEPVFSVSP